MTCVQQRIDHGPRQASATADAGLDSAKRIDGAPSESDSKHIASAAGRGFNNDSSIPNAELHQHVLSELASRHLRLSDVVDVLLQDVLANLPLLLALLIGSAALLWQSPISAALLLVGTLAVGMLLQRVERLQHPVTTGAGA